MGLSVWHGLRQPQDALGLEMTQELLQRDMPLRRALLWTLVGLALLIASSRLLVWGSVAVAQQLGVSDLIIGLTIVAIGTSLPELASSLIAVRKGEHDIALGNVVGSNFFNTLAVVGIAATISPLSVEPVVFSRDLGVMSALTLLLFLFAWNLGRKPSHIQRFEGAVLLAGFVAYTVYLVQTAF